MIPRIFFRTFFVLPGAVCEEILAVEVDPVPVEVVWLEEARPELRLGHAARHVLEELPPHGRVSLVDGVNGVHVQIVLEPVAAVRLGFDVRLPSPHQRTWARLKILSIGQCWGCLWLSNLYLTGGLPYVIKGRDPKRKKMNDTYCYSEISRHIPLTTRITEQWATHKVSINYMWVTCTPTNVTTAPYRTTWAITIELQVWDWYDNEGCEEICNAVIPSVKREWSEPEPGTSCGESVLWWVFSSIMPIDMFNGRLQKNVWNMKKQLGCFIICDSHLNKSSLSTGYRIPMSTT